MIPILFPKGATTFTTMGLGVLADAISVNVSRILNGKDELTMTYPSDGIRFSDIQNDAIIYAVPEYRKSPQPYQIYKITKQGKGRIVVNARHVGTQRAKYIPIAPFTAGSIIEAFNTLPTKVAETCPFTFWTNKDTVANFSLSRPASLGNVLGGMEGSILDVYGGEYEFDGFTIKLWNHRGVDSGVELRYGKNITKFEQSEDFDSIVTGVCPYWEGMDGETVYLPEIVVEGANADLYTFRRSIIKDFTENFDEKPSVSDLRTAATSWISRTGIDLPKLNLSVEFEHLAQYTEYEGLALLETLNIGDTVDVYYEPLGVSASARIVKTSYDVLQDKYDSVQIGSVRSSLSQIMSVLANDTESLKLAVTKGVPSAIEDAIARATDILTGVTGGNVVFNRNSSGQIYEILIMDTADKATATNVIRINNGGIGFSTSGYNGPFTTAWTIDSNFVADFITTGTLNAALAKIGLLADAAGKNSWNMQTGAFDITDGNITITATKNFAYADYSQTDLDRIDDIRNGTTDPTDADYEKYDINGDGNISAQDRMYIVKMMQTSTDLTRTITTTIDPKANTETIKIRYQTTPDMGGTTPAIDKTYFVGGPRTKLGNIEGQNITSGWMIRSGNANGYRADLSYDSGLSFYDSNGSLTALYPATGLPSFMSSARLKRTITSQYFQITDARINANTQIYITPAYSSLGLTNLILTPQSLSGYANIYVRRADGVNIPDNTEIWCNCLIIYN